jgi:hypothetical protein
MKYLIPLLAVLLIAACTPQIDFDLPSDPCDGDDQCYFLLTAMNNTFACPLISNEKIKSLCYVKAVEIEPKAEYCEKTLDSDRDVCYSTLGIQTKDITACDRSSGLSKDACYYYLAEESGDSTVCSSLESDFWGDTCYNYFGRSLEDKTMCFKISGADVLRDACIFNVSLATNNVDLCHSILGEISPGVFSVAHTTKECVTKITTKTNNTACSTLSDPQDIDECRFAFAIKNSDPLACEDIKSKFMTSRCVGKLENFTFDPNQIEGVRTVSKDGKPTLY